jgi:hypothetical protein
MLQRRKADKPSPNKWTSDEESALLEYLIKKQFDGKIAKKLLSARTPSAIRAKTRKLRIKYDLFGEAYRTDKQNFTEKVALKTKPKIVYEAYAGAGHHTLVWIKYSDQVYATD